MKVKKEISVWKAEFNSVATFRSGTPSWAVLTTPGLGLAVAVLAPKATSCLYSTLTQVPTLCVPPKRLQQGWEHYWPNHQQHALACLLSSVSLLLSSLQLTHSHEASRNLDSIRQCQTDSGNFLLQENSLITSSMALLKHRSFYNAACCGGILPFKKKPGGET